MKKNITLLLLLCFSFTSVAFGVDNFAYSDKWLYLVHYQKNGNNYKSAVDSSNFFIDKNGMNDPKAELSATIKLFETTLDDKRKCDFPARYKLLKKNNLIKSNYPKCEEYDKLLDAIKPAGITLIYTNAYMNNPASSFGHTLIRIDTKRKGTQLLAHGANYGALTGDDGGALFAVKGIFGGYFGIFTLRPYYDIINTYNNIENRDIWEYKLNFTDEEVDFFVAHLWEMSKTKITYYFFDKNCSYMILEMFDAVRPSLNLAKNFKYYTIPLDSLKAVNNKEGFVKETIYRPSRQSKILHRVSKMNKLQYKSLLEIIQKDKFNFENLNSQEQADILETAYQYTQYQFIERDLALDIYRKKSFKILKERSEIKMKPSFDDLKEGNNPAYAHDPKESGIGIGSRNGNNFYEISYRMSYNSLMNDSFGLLKGAEINLMNFDVRYYEENDDYVLHNLDIVKIKSLAASSELFSPLSFGLDFGIENFYNQIEDKDGYILNFDFGVGKSYQLSKNTLFYFLVNNYLGYGKILPNNHLLGIGLAGGIYQDIGKIRFIAEAESIYGSNEILQKTNFNFDIAYGITRNSYIGISYNFDDNKVGKNNQDLLLSLKFNF